MRRITLLTATPVLLCTLACVGGATLGTNEAGGDGWLDSSAPSTESEALQGDGRCAWTGRPYVGVTQERAYTLLNESNKGDCSELESTVIAERKTVWAMHPGDLEPQALIDVTGHEDVRLLDTSPGMLLMGQFAGQEALYLLDHLTLEVVAERQVPARYHGTRTAPSRDYVVVADNDQIFAPLTIIDPSTLNTGSLFDLDDWGEAMWAHDRDRLAAIQWDDDLGEATMVVWDFDEGMAAGLPSPVLEVTADAGPLLGMGFTWIGWHPDDEQVVFPVVQDGDEALLWLDVPSGQVRSVPDAAGPVAFTPDGSMLVAWDPDEQDVLVVVDPVTLETERLPLTLDGIPEYFVSHDGNQVVVADVFGGDELQIIDLDTGASVTLDARLPVSTSTVREGHDELWAVDDGLWRVDLAEAVVEEVPLDWTPGNVVWMPESDVLLLDDVARPRFVFWDPTLEETLTSADLSSVQGEAARVKVDLSIRRAGAQGRVEALGM